MMAMFLTTALFLAAIAAALWAILSTVLAHAPRIAEVFGAMAPQQPARTALVPARAAVRTR